RPEPGPLTTMAGGAREAFERARPIFERLGSQILHVAPSGAGSIVKLANQLRVGTNTAGVVEARVLATKAGADPQAVQAVLETSFGGSAMLSRNAPLILERSFGLGTTIDLLVKDLGLIDDLAADLAVRLLM